MALFCDTDPTALTPLRSDPPEFAAGAGWDRGIQVDLSQVRTAF